MKKYVLSLILFTAFTLSAQAQSSAKKVVLEEFTGAWCGWCPDGHVIMKDILSTQPNAIGIAVHYSDAMQFQDGRIVAGYYTSSYPAGVVNRTTDGLSRSAWSGTVNQELAKPSIVSVSFGEVEFNATTRELKVTVNADFSDPGIGEYRLNCAIVEDSVTGTGSGYNQANYLNGQAGHPMAGLGDPIVGYVHNHTLRQLLGRSWGADGVIPDTVNAGDNFSFTFTVPSLNPNWNENNINLVAWVAEYNGSLPTSRPILNAEEISFTLATDMENRVNDAGLFMDVAPNPASNRLSVAFNLPKTEAVEIALVNQLGQKVGMIAKGMMGSGSHTFYWDRNGAVSNGLYFVRLQTASGHIVTKRVMLAD